MPGDATWKAIATSPSFWSKLENKLKDLDNNKYKKGLEHSDSVKNAFSKNAMQDLQDTMVNLQRKIEKGLGIGRNEMPYNMGNKDKLHAFYKFTPSWNSDAGQ